MSSIATNSWPGVARTPRTPIKARIAKPIIKAAAGRVPVRLSFPNGSQWGAGAPGSPEMQVKRPRSFFARLGSDSKIGFGESYVAGDWTAGPSTDLADLLTPFADRLAGLIPRPLQRFRGFVDQKLPHHERNSVRGSRSNIERHYDLSNDLFAQFLDSSMTYSAALFTRPDMTLEEAQVTKLDAALDLAGVGAGTRLLEIGTGWGALALRAALRGAKVTTITISKEQAAYAQQQFAAAGVDVDLQLIDYREVSGSYDAIVSIEMIEAVGEEFWPTYFNTIDTLLAPGGKVAIQAITMEHDRYLTTRNSYGWIQKYIFPGGLIPSLKAIDATLAGHTSLAVAEQHSLGQDYARTLRLWREKFLRNWPDINAQGFDESFRRMWEFYLAYCEAGFRTGYLDVVQLQITRPATVAN